MIRVVFWLTVVDSSIRIETGHIIMQILRWWRFFNMINKFCHAEWCWCQFALENMLVQVPVRFWPFLRSAGTTYRTVPAHFKHCCRPDNTNHLHSINSKSEKGWFYYYEKSVAGIWGPLHSGAPRLWLPYCYDFGHAVPCPMVTHRGAAGPLNWFNSS